MAEVVVTESEISWYNDSRWWLYILYLLPDVDVNINLGDWVKLVDSDGDVILEGEVIRIKDNGVWLKSKDYIWLENNLGFVGSYVGEYRISKSILSIVDEAEISLSAGDIVMFDIGDDVEIWINRRIVMSGYVVELDDGVIGRRVRVYGYGRKLINVYVNLIYYNKDVFEIVKDMVERTTDLTVVGENTGIVLDKFIAKDFLISLVEDLAHIAGCQIRVEDKILYFEQLGKESSSDKLDNSNSRFGKWEVDMRQIVNELYLVGGELTYHYVDKFTGDGTTTEFKLTYRPTGNIKVTVNGEDLLANVDYEIDEEKPGIIFKVAPSSSTAPNIEVSYDYGIGVMVKVKNDNSIRIYGVHDKKVRFDWIKDFDSAKAVAWGIISMFSDPYIDVDAKVVLAKFVQSDIDLGKRVECVDDVSKKDVWMIVREVEYENNHVRLKLGSTLMTFDAWVSEVDDRLRMLEKERLGTEVLTQYSLFTEGISVSLSKVLYTMKVKKINGGLMFGRGKIGATDLGVKYGAWEVVF